MHVDKPHVVKHQALASEAYGSLEHGSETVSAECMQSSALLDALHLASPALPIGGFAYSQGLEQAVEDGLVLSAEDAYVWLRDVLLLVMARQELPLWTACYQACQKADWAALLRWNTELLALRETAEFKLESLQMGHSLAKIFAQWPATQDLLLHTDREQRWSYTAAHAALVSASQMSIPLAQSSYLWSWLENQVMAAVKIIPLGQIDGQKLLHRLKPVLVQAMTQAARLSPEEAGTAALGLAVTSSRHESQYSRLFRS